jgi:hypothetical protein
MSALAQTGAANVTANDNVSILQANDQAVQQPEANGKLQRSLASAKMLLRAGIVVASGQKPASRGPRVMGPNNGGGA